MNIGSKRKKIMVIISGGLPLPSVKGGAVETLIDMFLDENENTKKYDFETYSKWQENTTIVSLIILKPIHFVIKLKE